MTDSAPILQFATAEDALQSCNRRLVDVVDALLSQGIAIRGELWLTVADVDLVFLGLDLLLANPDRLQRTVPDTA
ncbi:gas vesicle protein GvpJ [Cereibacter johrii]|uniref:Gas vesicle protein GvpA/GvpJ/GvpM family n=1 Tax=Cereibacter johrii TaxID=445629 RepID=A0ABX5J915_9RHOB|nr:gas vesicle protein GvpJ [Cereibacter johrii]ODM43528.1 gas vesicle protein [Cereibacter johrii]PTM78582.1 gas vesicle protein GvpA/GvpJ/GvpM family [Cereibacter johrii]